MNSGRVSVGVNGYGVIGKRVADAVTLQDDMELGGVADIVSDYRIRLAVERGYPVYASLPARQAEMEANGIPVAGTLDDLLSKVDIVVDCAPKKVAAKNKEMYQSKGVKALFQGGEKHELTGYSFVAQVNYAGALNRQFARVVSCNTTGLCRINHALFRKGWIKCSRGVIMRRATDPWESHVNGMINTAVQHRDRWHWPSPLNDWPAFAFKKNMLLKRSWGKLWLQSLPNLDLTLFYAGLSKIMSQRIARH